MNFTRVHISHRASINCPAWGTHGPLSVSPAIPMLVLRRKHASPLSMEVFGSCLTHSSLHTSVCRRTVTVLATQSAVLSLERDIDLEDDEDAADMEDDSEEESMSGLSGFESSEEPSAAPLIHPTVMYQPKLDILEVKAMKAQAETLARDRRLLKVQIGNKGLTQTVVASIVDAMTSNTLVRVTLGEGAGLERGETALQLAALCDVVVVHQVGFTITLYRQAGLPRPDNSPRPISAKEAAAAAALAAEEAEEARQAGKASNVPWGLMQSASGVVAPLVVLKKKSRSKTKAAERAKKLKAIRAALPRITLPPEFSTV